MDAETVIPGEHEAENAAISRRTFGWKVPCWPGPMSPLNIERSCRPRANGSVTSHTADPPSTHQTLGLTLRLSAGRR